MNCIMCNNTTRVLYSKLPDRVYPEIPGTYTLKHCLNCGLIFIDSKPSEEELSAHYPETYDVYQRSISKPSSKKLLITNIVAKQYFRYGKSKMLLNFFLLPFYFKLSHLPHHVENGNLIDIGCGVGDRLPVFRELGWNAEGLEMNQKAAKVAQDAGYKIHVSTLEDVDLPENSFDAVYLNNVFEHLKDPHQALRKIKDILKHNGELILVVPNGDSLAFKLFKRNWFGLEIPRHLFTYNRKNLSKLLHQHGFGVEKIIFTYTFGSITSSAAYRFGKSVDTFSYFEKPIWMLNLFLDPFLNIFKIGDWMTIRARVVKDNV